MATVELIADLHEIKKSVCNAVRHVPDFIEVHTETHHQRIKLYGETWSNVENVTTEFEKLIEICFTNDLLKMEMKKFQLKVKVPITAETASTDNAQATELDIRLTTLINMIRPKKVYVKKPKSQTATSPKPKTQTSPQTLPALSELTLTQPKTPTPKTPTPKPKTPKPKTPKPKAPKIHKIPLDNCELRNFQLSDYTLPITNLAEFDNIQFYFDTEKNKMHIYEFGPVNYFVAGNQKLYVFKHRTQTSGELEHGDYFEKLQYWTL